MKLFIKKLFLLVILFLIMNYMFLIFITNFVGIFSKSIRVSKLKNQSYKCIAIGNSVVMDGIDSKYLTEKDFSTYNFGLDGTNLKSNYIQLKEYLKYNKDPDIVLLGLASKPEWVNRYFNDTLVNPIIEYSYNMIDWQKVENIPLIKYRWLNIEYLKKIVSKDFREDEYIQGQLRSKRIAQDKSIFTNENNLKIDDIKNVQYLEDIYNLCKKNRIRLRVLLMPVFKKYQNNESIGINIVPLENTKDSIEIINLNNHNLCSKIIDSNKDWLGNSHLNENGAKKITEFLFRNYLDVD